MNELKLDEITIGDRYQMRGRISTGSYAEVFVARDLQDEGREVVVKALNTDLQGTPDFALEQTLAENFAKEASILESISHPNIIAILTRRAFAFDPFFAASIDFLFSRSGGEKDEGWGMRGEG